MTHHTTLVHRCRATNSLLADEIEQEFNRLERLLMEQDQHKTAPIARVLTMEEAKYQALDHAILSTGGHMSEAARILGIGRSTLYRMLAARAESQP